MKSNLLRWGNIFLYFVFCILAATGLLLEYKTPLDEGREVMVLGIKGEDWGEIHLVAGLALIGLLVFHIWLNWQRTKKVVLDNRLWAGVSLIGLGMVMIIGLLLAPAQSSDKGSGCDREQYEREQYETDDE